MSLLFAREEVLERDRLLVHARPAQIAVEQLHASIGIEDRPRIDARLATLDPALGAAVLRAANAAHLGYSRRISGVRQASVMLGGTFVASLIAARVADLVFDDAPPDYPEWLWPHSLTVAAAASVLAKRLDESTDDAYTAGLLHDVGWLHAATSRTVDEDTTTTHPRACGRLFTRWNFPERLVAAVEHHHARSDALVDPLERIVVAAHGIAKAMGAGGPEPAPSKIESLRLVSLGSLRASTIIDETEQELFTLTGLLRGRG